MQDLISEARGLLRHEPIERRVRAKLGADTIVDSTRAMLLWEPRRVCPSYAVPAEDIAGELATAPATNGHVDGMLHPRIPFAVHTAEGEPVTVADRVGAGFRLADEDLAGYVAFDFEAFDWYEEDERVTGHPRDPFHRVDVLHSSRHVRIERDDTVLAESTMPSLLFEPPLPVRYYFAPDDVRTELLVPSDHVTYCAYKGRASYWSLAGEPDLAWCYREPLRDASEVIGRIAFFNERVDVVVDGVRQERPITPWSPRV
jgi:uncharacterized protein (DUF427 family)